MMDWESHLSCGAADRTEQEQGWAEIERLRLIVAALPKCYQLNDTGDGVVQDCAVTPGMTAWILDSVPMLDGPPVVEVARVTVGHVLSASCSVVNQHGYGIGNRSGRHLFNSPEAAEILARKETT